MPQFSSFLPLNAIPDVVIGWQRRWTNRSPFLACNDRTHSVFVHVPKAAGTSVCMALYGQEVGHLPAAGYRAADKRKFNEYFKFTFVRHPASRFLSAHAYLMGGGSPADQRFAKRHLSAFADRGTLIEHLLGTAEKRPIWSLLDWGHFRAQVDYVMIHGKIAVDFVGKLETINQDFEILSQRITGEAQPLGVYNRSEGAFHAPLSPEEEAAIEKIYSADYETFGYPRRF